MRLRVRHRRRQSLLATVAVTAASLGLAGCASATPSESQSAASLPTREQAFRQSESYINQILLAVHRAPTTEFTYSEGLCHETDDSHGAVVIDYSLPGSFTATQVDAELKAVGSGMKQLGYGNPNYVTQPNGVSVDTGSYGILFAVEGLGASSDSLGFSVQTCYATPAPASSAGAGVMQTLTVSPAPFSTAS